MKHASLESLSFGLQFTAIFCYEFFCDLTVKGHHNYAKTVGYM